MFTSSVTNSTRHILGPSSLINDARARITITSGQTNKIVSIANVLTNGQYGIIKQIHDLYTYQMSLRNYTDIPTDYDQYLTYLNDLNTINVSDSTMKLLMNIVEKALIGSMNIATLNDSVMYNEIQVLLLNNRIKDILDNKNTLNTVSDPNNISGQFSLQQTFKLSKIYSYYIHLYGMPQFGVGFDRNKLQFLQKSLNMFQTLNMDEPGAKITANIYDSSGGDVVVDIPNPLSS
jgi:hypothetical protein